MSTHPTIDPTKSDPEDSRTNRLATNAGASGASCPNGLSHTDTESQGYCICAERSEGSGVEGHANQENESQAGTRAWPPKCCLRDYQGAPGASRGSARLGVKTRRRHTPIVSIAGIKPGLPSLLSACNGPTGPCVLELGHPGPHWRDSPALHFSRKEDCSICRRVHGLEVLHERE